MLLFVENIYAMSQKKQRHPLLLRKELPMERCKKKTHSSFLRLMRVTSKNHPSRHRLDLNQIVMAFRKGPGDIRLGSNLFITESRSN